MRELQARQGPGRGHHARLRVQGHQPGLGGLAARLPRQRQRGPVRAQRQRVRQAEILAQAPGACSGRGVEGRRRRRGRQWVAGRRRSESVCNGWLQALGAIARQTPAASRRRRGGCSASDSRGEGGLPGCHTAAAAAAHPGVPHCPAGRPARCRARAPRPAAASCTPAPPGCGAEGGSGAGTWERAGACAWAARAVALPARRGAGMARQLRAAAGQKRVRLARAHISVSTAAASARPRLPARARVPRTCAEAAVGPGLWASRSHAPTCPPK